MSEIGKVFLVGAGPGNAGLITVRGLKLLKEADVIVYDRLGTSAFISAAKSGAELIDAGKCAGNHKLSQNEINESLVRAAKAGKRVVRLKGGDPLVFGRGGEEMEALRAAEIPFEVVPGVSSAIAGPAYAGIPITHRDCTSALAIVTGHEADDKENSQIPWAALAQMGSVVFLMGVKSLGAIAAELIAGGKLPDTPVAVIERATLPKQRTLVGTLADIKTKAQSADLKTPALIVVGEVVKYRERLAWFENKPFFGRTIVVTRARAQISELASLLREMGAEVIECPVIKVEPILPNPQLDAFLQKHEKYDELIFTSANGVEVFVESLLSRGLDLRISAGKRILCIGPATADAFKRYGILADAIPQTYISEAMLSLFKGREPDSIAVLRAETAREVLPEELRKMGFSVDVIPLYRTIAEKPDSSALLEAISNNGVDIVTFTSSSTVERFLELADELNLKVSSLPVAAIGPVTAETCRKHGLMPVITAEEHTISGLVSALETFFAKK